MNTIRSLLTTALIVFLVLPLRVPAEPASAQFQVSIDPMNWQAYQDIDNGLDNIPARINQSLSNDRRVLSDFYIMQRAIELTGQKSDLSFYPGTNSYKGYTQAIKKGAVLANGDSQFIIEHDHSTEHFYITQPVLKGGQFHVGLYTDKQNTKALNATMSSLKDLSAISNPHWQYDWQELSRLNLKRLDPSKTWQDIFEAISSLRSDFTLQAFSRRPDLSFHYQGKIFLPIAGLKLQFKQSRHYVISKQHPQGKAFYQRLEQGLTQMRRSAKIDKIYQETGVFNLKVRDWTLVNP